MLLDLVATKVNYVVQEAVCVIKDILRKYPHRYENVIPSLAENLDALDDPAARASLIWMIGEYAEKITNAGELLETFLDGFKDEPTSVLSIHSPPPPTSFPTYYFFFVGDLRALGTTAIIDSNSKTVP